MRSIELRMSRTRPRSAAGMAGAAVALAFASGLAGCGTIAPVEPSGPPVTDPTQLYTRLVFNYPAISLSTDGSDPAHNTIQLVATPLDAHGTPMPGLPTPTYRSIDTTRIRVTADGMVTALGTGSDLRVTAELTSGRVQHVDTAVINVTDDAPQLATLSIDPIAPDSGFWPIVPEANSLAGATYLLLYGGYLAGATVTPRALDGSGAEIGGLPYVYESLDPTIASITRRDGTIKVFQPGQVRLVIRTYAYGTVKADTAVYTVTPPSGQDVTVRPAQAATGTGPLVFFPSEVTIRRYGIVVWNTMQADTVDVTFDDPGKALSPPSGMCAVVDFFNSLGLGTVLVTEPSGGCGRSGNALVPGLPPQDENGIPAGAFAVRQFTEPGTYTYHSVQTGATGRIVVTEAP